MKKVMIVGASAWQVPMIKKAKELGYNVGVVDYNPSAIGIQYADEYFNASTIDPEGVCEAVRRFGADGITTVATDMPMRAIAYTCEKLGLKGIDNATAIRSTDKVAMIKAFEEHNVPHPWFHVIKNFDLEDVKDKISFPCICKPTDNAASRGVIIVNNALEIENAVRYSSLNGRCGDVIIEELLVGCEISVEAFVIDGGVHVLAITDKITTGRPYFVEMGHNQPSKFQGELKAEIIDVTAKAIRAVGIVNGPAHVEMMVTATGPRMIELGARLGGDFITTDLVPLSTGIDMLGATIHFACGEKVDLEPKFEKASAVRYMESSFGKILEVEHLDEANHIPGVWRVEMLKQVGGQVTEIKNSLDRIGYVVAQGNTVKEAEELCYKALNTVKVSIGEA